MQLRDKKVLLTGASGGIGKALAETLMAQGAILVLAGRDATKLQALAQQLDESGNKIKVVTLDLGGPQLATQASAIAQQHADIDVLINCAGNNMFAACTDTLPEQTAALINTNLTGTLVLTQILLPCLLQRSTAMIVNIGSTFGSIGYPGFTVYCATKFGLRGFTEALRRELADTQVKVLYVAPRATATDMNASRVVAMNKALGNAMDRADYVAACVLKAMEREYARLSIGWPEKLFVIINGVFTRIVDKALRKQLPVIQRFLTQEVR